MDHWFDAKRGRRARSLLAAQNKGAIVYLGGVRFSNGAGVLNMAATRGEP